MIECNGLETPLESANLLDYARRARIEGAIVAKIQYKEAQRTLVDPDK